MILLEPEDIHEVEPLIPETMSISLGEHSLEEIERQLIIATVKRFSGNKIRAAVSLGLCTNTIYKRLKKYRNAAA
jgi:DNA-binding NtrC family response regulator